MANYGENGYIDFSKLWELLEKKELNKQWLKNKLFPAGSKQRHIMKSLIRRKHKGM